MYHRGEQTRERIAVLGQREVGCEALFSLSADGSFARAHLDKGDDVISCTLAHSIFACDGGTLERPKLPHKHIMMVVVVFLEHLKDCCQWCHMLHTVDRHPTFFIWKLVDSWKTFHSRRIPVALSYPITTSVSMPCLPIKCISRSGLRTALYIRCVKCLFENSC